MRVILNGEHAMNCNLAALVNWKPCFRELHAAWIVPYSTLVAIQFMERSETATDKPTFDEVADKVKDVAKVGLDKVKGLFNKFKK